MANHLEQAPIMRLFKLGTSSQKVAEFGRVGVHNLTKSIETEPGTLAMYATHLVDNNKTNFVLELYRDEESYNSHVASAHFKAFADFAAQGLTDRAVFQLQPQLLLEKEAPLFVKEKNNFAVRLAQVQVREDSVQAFKDIVTDEMRQAVAKEAGVLAMYAATVVDRPSSWLFFEIYEDEAAYDAHRQTEHFQAYIQGTQDMVMDKQLTRLSADTLVNQGGLVFDE